MVPVYNTASEASPFRLEQAADGAVALSSEGSGPLAQVEPPPEPRFYSLSTAEGIPYSAIALLHGRHVLATTLLQTCIRFRDRSQSCQFCAIEQSLEDGRTLVRKSPEQVAEVAEAAVRLDGVRQLVMTTGTPNSDDRGARLMAETAAAVKARVNLPIQGQCEPPTIRAGTGACNRRGSTAWACTSRWWTRPSGGASCRGSLSSASSAISRPSPRPWRCSAGGR